jgi:ABC-2 type transport system ATP-binding protein
MRRRIDIAASILNTPDLLFLDEPTTGLDPRSRNQVWDIVRAVVAQGTTVLLTTQYLDEADQLASRIAVIDHGRVIAEGTKGELKASVGAGSVHLRLRDAAQRSQAEKVLAVTLGSEVTLDADPVALTARVDGASSDLGAAEQAARALAELSREGITVDNFSLGQPSLDEVFLALTDRKAAE